MVFSEIKELAEKAEEIAEKRDTEIRRFLGGMIFEFQRNTFERIMLADCFTRHRRFNIHEDECGNIMGSFVIPTVIGSFFGGESRKRFPVWQKLAVKNGYALKADELDMLDNQIAFMFGLDDAANQSGQSLCIEGENFVEKLYPEDYEKGLKAGKAYAEKHGKFWPDCVVFFPDIRDVNCMRLLVMVSTSGLPDADDHANWTSIRHAGSLSPEAAAKKALSLLLEIGKEEKKEKPKMPKMRLR